MAIENVDRNLVAKLSQGVSAKDAVAEWSLAKAQQVLELDDVDFGILSVVLSNEEIMELASVSSTYGTTHAGGRPSSSGRASGKSKIHNAFPKPKKPKKPKKSTAFPSPAQNRANLKKALRLAYELGYTEFNPDTIELSEREFSTETREKLANKGKALKKKEGAPSYPTPDCDAVHRAVQSYGRAKPEDRERLKAMIKKRIKALGCKHYPSFS